MVLTNNNPIFTSFEGGDEEHTPTKKRSGAEVSTHSVGRPDGTLAKCKPIKKFPNLCQRKLTSSTIPYSVTVWSWQEVDETAEGPGKRKAPATFVEDMQAYVLVFKPKKGTSSTIPCSTQGKLSPFLASSDPLYLF